MGENKLTAADKHKPAPSKAPLQKKESKCHCPPLPPASFLPDRPRRQQRIGIIVNRALSDGDQASPAMALSASELRDFFSDCPWLNVPPHRQALIIEEPLYPRGRLLGGAPKDGKMSKLAALAAKRRKDKEAAQSVAADSPAEPNDYAERLRQLHVTQPSPFQKADQQDQDAIGKAPADEAVTLSEEAAETPVDQIKLPEAGHIQHLRRPPSTFASILTQNNDQRAATPDALLPVDNLSSRSTFDFSQPSPDDVFRKAQGSK